MNQYISALLDFRSKFYGDSVEIDCKYEKIAKVVHPLTGGTLNGVKITIKDQEEVDKFYKNYAPHLKYEEYRVICMKKLAFPLIKQEPSHEYMAGLFDLTGSFKAAVKRESVYGNVTFRNKNTLDILSHFYKKPCKDQIYFSGEEMLWALEHLKEFLIVKKDQAEVLCNCVANPDDPDNWPDWLATQKDKR